MAHLRRPFRFYTILALILCGAAAALLHLGPGWHFALAWLLAVNVFAFPLWAWDKLMSRRRGPRVPEANLHVLAAAGATPASLLAMALLRHKTQKPAFLLLYALFLVAQVAAVALVIAQPWAAAG